MAPTRRTPATRVRTAGRTRPRPTPQAQPPVPVRMTLLGLALALAFGVILAQLGQLQVVEGPELAARAAKQQHKTIRLTGTRGTITDRNGIILARNMDVPSITADPSEVASARTTARALARVLPASASQLQRRIERGSRRFAWIERRTDPATATRVMDLGLEGIHLVPESRRFYPKGQLMGHILGFAGMDNHGLSGVERAFNDRLAGAPVSFVMARDAFGRSVFPSDGRYTEPVRGADLQMTIDEVIQYHVERELDRAMAKTRAVAGSVVVMAPDTGEILAMAVRPEFDPNRVGKYGADTFRNRILTDPYEPGSTLKTFVAAIALDSGAVTLDETIFCENGRMPLRGGALHDSHGHGDLTFAQVLVKSSNIGTAKVAMRMGPERLRAGLARFGFGQRTGLELPGESAGVLPPVSRWSGRSLASIAIGQEMSATPMQLARAASAVANGGWLMRPYLIQRIANHERTLYTRPKRVTRVLSEETAAALREALVGVTEPGGTAPQAHVPGFSVAGKTGTAQKADLVHGGYAKDKYVASFLGMVPADKPALVILVVIDEPQGKAYYGGQVAGPVFAAIARPVLQYLGVHPKTDRTVILTAEPATARRNTRGEFL